LEQGCFEVLLFCLSVGNQKTLPTLLGYQLLVVGNQKTLPTLPDSDPNYSNYSSIAFFYKIKINVTLTPIIFLAYLSQQKGNNLEG